ncbi:hypothetical protein AT746_06735 [Lacimicrobium alkaliphilum]|uniref:Solute-binding protein family 3/N-terminal domain-containing protein n=1 Tax=Lacimicrobium alkaliphilum TaxID=1526571 RepID=A0A0U3B8J3_9ALTE|nr:hypothetical protein AT746_06735 [Lacimicrobium alkaliphilum]
MRLSLFILLAIAPWCLAQSNSAPADVPASVELCVDDFPPRQILNKDGSWSGHSIDVIRAIMAHLDIPLTITADTPFPRCLLKMQQGETDLMVGLRKNPEREAYMQMMPYSVAATSLFFSKSDFPGQINKLTDLQDRVIGAVRGFTYSQGFELFRHRLQLVEVHSLDAGFGMLQKGRIELMLATDYLGQIIINKPEFSGQFKAQPLALTTEAPVYIGLSKQSPAFIWAERIQAAVDTLREQGHFEAILKRSKAALKDQRQEQEIDD